MSAAVKVVQVATTTDLSEGGPAVGMVQLNAALRRTGTDARLLTTKAWGQSAPTQVSGARLHASNRLGPLELSCSAGQAWLVLKTSRDAAFIHSHGLYLGHNVWTFLSHKLWRVPYSVQLHGVLEPYQRNIGRSRKAIWDLAFGKRFLRGAACIVVASSTEAQGLPASTGSNEVLVMPLGVPPVLDRAEALWSSRGERDHVLFLGRLATKKRVDLLLQAWKLVFAQINSRSVLTIAGSGPEEQRIRRMIRGLGLEASVRLAGQVEGETKDALLRSSTLFVLPSDNENFGIAAAEAMSYALPMLLSDQVAVSKGVLACRGGWVVPADDLKELAQALQDALASSFEERLEMGRRNQAQAEASYTWDSAARLLLQAHGAECS